MKYVMVKAPTCWRTVTWKGVAEDGSIVENAIRIKFEIIGREDFLSMFGIIADRSSVEKVISADRQIFERVVRGWEGPADEQGSPVPFTEPYIGQMLDVPGFVEAVGAAYVLAWNGVEEEREGNSEASPGTGSGATPAASGETSSPAA